MSGDVQPRKRKDKKKKKDDLGVEEPRGTAAALGEGDVFMHSHHEHGTGGHWCAKIIFFSLLAVLIGLIGLIILENRGLSELEAQAVESRYSGVLEGWLEDAPDDDHHDAHTLELKHHDDHDDDDHEETDDHDDEENGHDDDEDEENGDETEEDDHDIEAADDEDKRSPYSRYFGNDDEDEHNEEGDEEDEREQNDEDELDDDDDVEENDDDNYDNEGVDEENDDNDEENDDNDEDNEENGDDDENQSNEIEERDDDEDKEDNSYENNDEDLEDEEAGHDDDDEDEEDEEELEVEKIEHEASDEEPISVELPALPEEDDDDDDHKDDDDDDDDADNQPEQADADDDQADDDSQPDDNDQADEDDNQDDDDDFLDPEDDGDEPPIEKISAPAGKPFVEVEEETSSEKPPDTLEEEEEYEKLQEQKRQEEAQASHIWLKVGVGALLVAATHAVLRRASAGETPEPEETPIREATPLIDRRMTLIPEETEPAPKKAQELAKPVVEEVVKKVTSPVKFAPPPKQESEEEEQEDIEEVEMEDEKEDKELYSDEDEEEAVVDEEAEVEEKKEAPKTAAAREPTPESEAEEDVEIIDEVLDEDEEELEEEEISDVDDAELLTRLEEKYGRLPEPDRPGPKFYKDGGNSVEDDWPGEPSDPYWRKQLDSIDQELRQGSWSSALERASAPSLANSARARYLLATALDKGADVRRDNALLTRAIAAYIHLLKMNEELSDEKLLLVTNRTLQRIQFRGTYLKAEPVYKLLIRRFPNEPVYRNNLTVAFLMANRADLAENVLKETLKIWPNDRLALAHYGFVLKNERNRLEEAVDALQKALKDDTGPACEPRYYYHLGDALLLLGRYSEAHEVHKRGANHGHFLSPAQRSLYNVPRLKSRPWWNVDETPYARLARALEKSWKEILKEGEAARALYEKEREGLKAKGDWTQLDLFVRGQEIPGRCKKAPVTCSIVKTEQAAVGCRRGQIKFSAMEAGTHVRPHVGPTNCRIRMHLGLSNTKDTYIRVDQEIRQWQEGKVLMFDDSFEHEVWHNGTGKRLVLILDVWHPDLTLAERSQLPAI